jgi:hypothetical protein
MDPARSAALSPSQTLASAAVTHGTTLVASYPKGVGRVARGIGRLSRAFLGAIIGYIVFGVPIGIMAIAKAHIPAADWLIAGSLIVLLPLSGYVAATISRKGDLLGVFALIAFVSVPVLVGLAIKLAYNISTSSSSYEFRGTLLDAALYILAAIGLSLCIFAGGYLRARRFRRPAENEGTSRASEPAPIPPQDIE